MQKDNKKIKITQPLITVSMRVLIRNLLSDLHSCLYPED